MAVVKGAFHTRKELQRDQSNQIAEERRCLALRGRPGMRSQGQKVTQR